MKNNDITITNTIDMNKKQRISISERRATYPLQERLKIYGPDTMARRFSDQEKHSGKLMMNGVNILNKTSLDSDTMMHRIKQRRETHNRVERRRRDKLNNLVNELAQSIPLTSTNDREKYHRAKILRRAIDYIRLIQQENKAMKIQLGQSSMDMSMLPEASSSPSSESDITSSDNESQNNDESKRTSSKFIPPAFDTFCFQI
ncbi:uncharacterized protein BX664DRAFT_343515 [Halteromyces radiatus]|uniref:uncharacterized protein n=1 Tax=Halteromyces radiatus TaxID=101107 RepID=UPI00221FB11E|nr:uncharacterized protein BX664DRAFT_343515 [Halteromyces radiatus]KAI8077800.1 hypothetical protein BX664DRAFT_343515 [Halteromyces radiatus]